METPTTHVTIPNCTATHVLGDTSILLASGRLYLIRSSSTALAAPSPTTPAQAHPVFTLKIGELAFPLLKDTLFGTDATNPRVYLFAPELGQSSEGGYVRLELPKEALEEGSEVDVHQEAFERALVAEGLLKEGWSALGNMFGRGAEAADNKSEQHRAQPGTSHPTTLAPAPHSFLDTSTQATGATSDWTKSAGQTVSNAATTASKWVGSKVGGVADAVSNSFAAEGGGVPAEAISEDEEDRGEGEKTMVDVAAGVKSAAKGAATGASGLASSLSTRASAAMKSNHGRETGGKAGETARNDAVLGTSNGGEAAAGAGALNGGK